MKNQYLIIFLLIILVLSSCTSKSSTSSYKYGEFKDSGSYILPTPFQTTAVDFSRYTDEQVKTSFFSTIELMVLPERREMLTWWMPFGKTKIRWLEKDIYQIEFVSGLADNKDQIEQWLFYMESKSVKPLNGGSLVTAAIFFCKDKNDPKAACKSYFKEMDELKQKLGIATISPTPTLKPTGTPVPSTETSKPRNIIQTPNTAQIEQIVKYGIQALPIAEIYEKLMSEWNSWLEKSSEIEYQRNLPSRARYMDSKLRQLYDKLLLVITPKECENFKNFLTLAISKNIEYFQLVLEYARTNNENYRIKADAASAEALKFHKLSGEEWQMIRDKYLR